MAMSTTMSGDSLSRMGLSPAIWTLHVSEQAALGELSGVFGLLALKMGVISQTRIYGSVSKMSLQLYRCSFSRIALLISLEQRSSSHMIKSILWPVFMLYSPMTSPTRKVYTLGML